MKTKSTKRSSRKSDSTKRPVNPYAVATLAEALDGPRSPMNPTLGLERLWSDGHDEEVITWSYWMDALEERMRRDECSPLDLRFGMKDMIPVARRLPALRQVALAMEKITEALEFIDDVHAIATEIRSERSLP